MSQEYEIVMKKILQILETGKNAEVKKGRDGKLKVMVVNKKIV